jgi:CpXC motif protein
MRHSVMSTMSACEVAMGVYHPYDVICPVCEGRFSANLVNSVNVSRFPDLKTKLLDRTLNRVRCPRCGDLSIIEKPFFYSDFKRKQFIAVYPRKERHFHERASSQTHAVFSAFAALKYGDAKNSRVVFGLEELREKVVAADNEIDDHALELLKLYVIREHPFIIDRPRMRITLNDIDKEKVEFYCTFDLDRDFFKAYVPRAYLGTLRGATYDKADHTSPFPRARKLAKAAFAPKVETPWVNLWSLNPSNDALSLLSTFAEAIRAHKAVNPEDAKFKTMLRTLPSGNQLPSWAKRDIQTIADFARASGLPDVEKRVFEIRFGFGIGDDWFKNADKDDVRTIWTLLKDLPDIAVEGNTWIKAIYLDKDKGGGYYDPSTKEIHIGSKIESGTNYFRNVVLHEVGHAVQEQFDRQKADVITKWLADDFGWQTFEARSKPIDDWIELMGGYPPGTTVQTKTQVRSYIQQSIGKGDTFDAAKIVNGPAGHLWNDSKFGPRRAFELTGSNWYERCDRWHKHNGKRFFVNYHYVRLMAVDEATIKLVALLRQPKPQKSRHPHQRLSLVPGACRIVGSVVALCAASAASAKR